MEFRTSQGGETTLVFDEGETLQLDDLAKRQRMTFGDLAGLLHKHKQAHPLLDFDQLLELIFPRLFSASGLVGVVPAKKQRPVSPPDPLDALEADIRRKLGTVSAGPVGSTSQTMQVEAMLLQALATVLQTRELRRLAEVEDA